MFKSFLDYKISFQENYQTIKIIYAVFRLMSFHLNFPDEKCFENTRNFSDTISDSLEINFDKNITGHRVEHFLSVT